MKYLVVIGLLMVGVQMDASQLKPGKKSVQLSTNSYFSIPGVALNFWQRAGHESMKQSIDVLKSNFDEISYQNLITKLEEKNKFLEEIRKKCAQEISKNRTLKSGLEQMSEDFADLKKQLDAIVLVNGLEKGCKEMTTVVSSEEEANVSQDSYKNSLSAAQDCLDFLNSQRALLPGDKYEDFKAQLEGVKAKIEGVGERHGFKEKSAATTTTQAPSLEQQGEQIKLKIETKPAEIQKPTPERSVSIPTVPAGNTVVSIPPKSKYNWKALFGIGAGVVTVAATVIWYLWSPKNIIISHS